MRWSYGITTVPSRLGTYFPRTVASLKGGGFDRPHLFVDGGQDARLYADFQHEGITLRNPAVRTAGNWVLSLYELYYRVPTADRYALFQDDLLMSRNVRQYLEGVPYPDNGYLNLYTFSSSNEIIIQHRPPGFYESGPLNNKPVVLYPGGEAQVGRGAVALVFSRPALLTLLRSPTLVERPMDCDWGHRKIDGGIVTAMNQQGWREYVHAPSLVQHAGLVSSMRNRPHPLARTWRGEEFDCLALLDGSVRRI